MQRTVDARRMGFPNCSETCPWSHSWHWDHCLKASTLTLRHTYTCRRTHAHTVSCLFSDANIVTSAHTQWDTLCVALIICCWTSLCNFRIELLLFYFDVCIFIIYCTCIYVRFLFLFFRLQQRALPLCCTLPCRLPWRGNVGEATGPMGAERWRHHPHLSLSFSWVYGKPASSCWACSSMGLKDG